MGDGSKDLAAHLSKPPGRLASNHLPQLDIVTFKCLWQARIREEYDAAPSGVFRRRPTPVSWPVLHSPCSLDRGNGQLTLLMAELNECVGSRSVVMAFD